MNSVLTLASAFMLILLALVCFFQLALICGAPWGDMTLGGRWSGRLPWQGRLIAALSLVLLLLFAALVSHRAGWPSPLMLTPAQSQSGTWLLTGYCVLGVIANAMTRSKRERQLWLPVVTLMLLASLIISLNSV